MHLLCDEFGVAAKDEIERRGFPAVHLGEVAIGAIEPGAELGLAAATPQKDLGNLVEGLKGGLYTGAGGVLAKVLLGHSAKAGEVGERNPKQGGNGLGIETAVGGIAETGAEIEGIGRLVNRVVAA